MSYKKAQLQKLKFYVGKTKKLMKINTFLTILLICFIVKIAKAQEVSYEAFYPDSLQENANAIIKENLVEIELFSFNKMSIKKKRVVTIFNEKGLKHINANEYFDNSTVIKNIEAKIYDKHGIEIKKIKRKDFEEVSISTGSIITDYKKLFFEDFPNQYPFTVVFESQITSSNTALIPTWYPIEDYFVSIVKNKLTINYADDVKLKYKEINADKRTTKRIEKNHLEFQINNCVAINEEQLSPSAFDFMPHYLIALEEFEIEGVKGYANDWKSFGKWMYDNLLKDTEEIPEATIQKIQTLIGQEKNKIAIAKIIYKYVQEKTRYVSIQLGIGGWKPMLAKNVDRLGYGDCKALTNYTRSLLKVFNIPSYYAIVYAGKKKRNIHQDFASMQGNHVILGIPDTNEIHWLECTSQTQPFGFQGSFTDDRNALIISEDKIDIIKTKSFLNESNSQETKAKIKFTENGTMDCQVIITSKGIEFNEKLFLGKETSDNKTKYYKNKFSQINNLKIAKNELTIDKAKIEMQEILNLKADDFIKKTGDRILLNANILNQILFIPEKYKNRSNPFEIERGYQYIDEIEIEIPKGYKIETKTNEFEINTKFGNYKSKLENYNNTLIFKRSFILKKGYYLKGDYNSYRDFREQIAKKENIKTVLIKE